MEYSWLALVINVSKYHMPTYISVPTYMGLEYIYNFSIDDLSQHNHRLSMPAYVFDVGKGDLCQHVLSLSLYIMFIYSTDDLCQYKLSMSE